MKRFLFFGVLCFLSAGFRSEAYAVPAFPRDLDCKTPSGERVILRSNNQFWSYAQQGRYNIELVLDQGGGKAEVLPVAWVNNDAQRVRGNDEGNRRYIFVSGQGKEFHVELEFDTQRWGLATGIKIFRVISSTFQFEHTQSHADGLCGVVHHSRLEI